MSGAAHGVNHECVEKEIGASEVHRWRVESEDEELHRTGKNGYIEKQKKKKIDQSVGSPFPSSQLLLDE